MDDYRAAPIPVALLDDQRLVREGLGGLLEETGAAQVVCSGAQADALEATLGANPAVVMIGFDAQLHDPIATVQRVARRIPSVPLCAIVAAERDGIVQNALAAGCGGVVSADASVEVVIAAIRSLAAGEAYVDAKFAGHILGAQLGPKHGQNGRATAKRNGGSPTNRGTAEE